MLIRSTEQLRRTVKSLIDGSLVVLGVKRSDGSVTYIYDVNYEMPILTDIIRKLESDGLVYQINPAFAPGLQLQGEFIDVH